MIVRTRLVGIGWLQSWETCGFSTFEFWQKLILNPILFKYNFFLFHNPYLQLNLSKVVCFCD
jgi:hypothetical protein